MTRSLSSGWTLQYKLLSSTDEKSAALPIKQTYLSMRVIRYKSGLVTAFGLRLRTENVREPSFLGANTIADSKSV